MNHSYAILPFFAVLFAAGCASYSWKSSVPAEMRTVAVPVFENRTNFSEMGPVATQYVLREFQREGTFRIKRSGASAVEVQGAITKVTRNGIDYDRGYGMRASEYRLFVEAEVSLIDKTSGKVLLDNRHYTAETTFLTQGDLLTGQRNASFRIAQSLARQIVDDVVAYPYDKQDPAVQGVQK